MSFVDCLAILLDVFMLTMFGTVLSSIINYFLTTQGQLSAVATIVSSMYGFVSGAYMPIASFGKGLQNVLMFLPGTYGSSLLRNHCMGGAFNALQNSGIPAEAIAEIKNSVDFNLYFFGEQVSVGSMYLILTATIFVLLGIYILMNVVKKHKKHNQKKYVKA